MRSAWNKGLTKDTSESVRRISTTMRRKRLDNFKDWRDEMIRLGKIKSEYHEFKKNGDLAELIGVILGDGHIGRFPRTESLRIVAHSINTGFVERYALMVERIFGKKPYVAKRKLYNATDITIYEKNISVRLGIPVGSRAEVVSRVPKWILENKSFIIRYLRGLYEAEGSLSFHPPTYTHKFIFSNHNESLLNIVFRLVDSLGFHPHRSRHAIQISKKNEVQKLEKLLKFRRY